MSVSKKQLLKQTEAGRTIHRPAEIDAIFFVCNLFPVVQLTCYEFKNLLVVKWQEEDSLVDPSDELITLEAFFENWLNFTTEISKDTVVFFQLA